MRFYHAPVDHLRRSGNSTVKTFTSNGNNHTIRTDRKYSNSFETSNQSHQTNESSITDSFLTDNDLATDLMTHHELNAIRQLSDKQNQSEDIPLHQQLVNKCLQSVNDINYNNQIEDCCSLNNAVNQTKINLNIEFDNTDSIREIGRNNSFYDENSPDDSFMDEEDGYSPTPSICVSLNSPEPPRTYPRGIINPNYPGFQHLAHTLSEHFIDHQFGNMSDSDVSEFECDIAVDKQQLNDYENIFNRNRQHKRNQHNSNNNNNNNHNNNNNNNNNQTNRINHSHHPKKLSNTYIDRKITNPFISNNNNENLTKVKEMIRCAFDTDRDTYSLSPSHGQVDIPSNCIANDVENNKMTTTLNDDFNIVKDNQAMEPWELETYSKPSHNSDKIANSSDANDVIHDKNFALVQPPDILLKTGITVEPTVRVVEQDGKEKPDILKNVARSVAQLELDDNDKHESNEPLNGSDKSSLEKDDQTPWGITPVDIVGDFKQEVEREFGLLVSGYKNNGDNEVTMLPPENHLDLKSVGNGNGHIFEMITDAALSNANETISVSGIGVSDDVHWKATSDDIQIDYTNQIGENKDKIRNSIPTAIVKPKYQKSSYDDRQLPAIANVDREKPWYDDNNINDTVVTITKKKVQQLPHFERKRSKQLKHLSKTVHGQSTTGTSKETLNSMLECEKDVDSSLCTSVAIVQPRKKDKMEQESLEQTKCDDVKCATATDNITKERRHARPKESIIRAKAVAESKEISASFDVYNIETALPVIDLEAIENHLKAAKEEERRKRNDREEIRRRLAMGAEDDYLSKMSTEKPTRKPSLHSRLQEGMNLQICFMNETASDNESPSSDSESCPKLSKSSSFASVGSNQIRYSAGCNSPHPYNARPLSVKKNQLQEKARPANQSSGLNHSDEDPKAIDFFTKQARLQIEARMALAQAKDMAHMQMEMERQKQKESPITGIIRNSLQKVGIVFPAEKRRVSRQMLTDMNIAQLQIIVNDFHTQIERLNEQLVQYLMDRDDLHMSQDSMLVDIEDLTRYLGERRNYRTTSMHKYRSTTNFFPIDLTKKPPQNEITQTY